jgi:hypothetical protein
VCVCVCVFGLKSAYWFFAWLHTSSITVHFNLSMGFSAFGTLCVFVAACERARCCETHRYTRRAAQLHQTSVFECRTDRLHAFFRSTSSYGYVFRTLNCPFCSRWVSVNSRAMASCVEVFESGTIQSVTHVLCRRGQRQKASCV